VAGEPGDRGDVGASIEKIANERSPKVVRTEPLDARATRAALQYLQDALRRHSASDHAARLIDRPEQRAGRFATDSEPASQGSAAAVHRVDDPVLPTLRAANRQRAPVPAIRARIAARNRGECANGSAYVFARGPCSALSPESKVSRRAGPAKVIRPCLFILARCGQVPDHLACYRIQDPQTRTKYLADLDGLVVEPGCTIRVPAVMACVPATKTNVAPTPPGGGGTGTPNSFLCYKVRCRKASLPTFSGSDQFGSRTVTPKTAQVVCAPLAGPPTTTTSTTATTSTTTTTTSTTNSTTTTTSLRFMDNGDGTVTDHQTGLQWEKKVAGTSCLHCVDDGYTWSASGSAPDGTAFTAFLNTLNGGATGVGDCISWDGSAQTGGFANHCDWRIATIGELHAIFDGSAPGCGSGNACIDPIFGPTAPSEYWSSTTYIGNGGPTFAWFVHFDGGVVVGSGLKVDARSVRAVRSGS